jgi:predicted Zn finger-like uncharacterized protein
MKIVCDNCATKYSIADEKVRGKVFKIRCKKCSHIIVVRGNEGAAAAPEGGGGGAEGFPGDEPPTTVAPGGMPTSDAVWHLVVDREQVGPLTAAEVRRKFAAGEIDVETYGWREGFADWLRLGSIDDFRDLAGAQPEPEGATRRTDSADLFSNSNSGDDSGGDAGSDLFGSSAPAASAPAPMAAADSFGGGGGGGLFGAPEQAAPAPSRSARTSSPGFAATAQPAMAMGGGGEAVSDGQGKMTGQRNENSVLFSLNNLQALASGGNMGSSPSSAPKPGVDNRPGFANSQTEGSGLIDIRAMAASTLAASPASSSKGGSDEPEIAAAPIFSPMAAPILMPAAPSGPPKWIWAVLGVGVLAVLGIVVVGVLLLTRKPEPAPVIATGPAPGATAPAANPGATAPAAAPAKEAAAPAKEDAKATAPDKAGEEKTAAKSSHEKTPKAPKVPGAKASSPKESSSPAAAPAPEAAPAPAPKKGGGKKDALDDLLNGASPDAPAAKPRREAAESGGGGDDSSLPDQLEKSQIVQGMSSVKGKVGSCYDQFKVPGMASVNVTIQKSGSISNASVGGSFAGTPTGSCVEKAVKGAHFPKFKGSAMSLTYPFMLR